MDPSWPSSVSSETLATRPRAYARGWRPRGPALPRTLGSGRGDAEARVGASLWYTAGQRGRRVPARGAPAELRRFAPPP